MKKFKHRIILEKREEILEQNDYFESEEIEREWQKYAKSIGEFLISFSILESRLNEIIITIINDRADDLGFQVIKYFKFRDKINFANESYMQAISWSPKNKKKKRIKDQWMIIVKKLEEMSEFRNKIAHANWATLKKGFVRTSFSTNLEQGSITFKNIKMTPSVIRKFINQTDSLTDRISKFEEQFGVLFF